MRGVVDAQRADLVGEALWRGKLARQRVLRIGHAGVVEEHGAGDVLRQILSARVPAGVGQVQGRVDDADRRGVEVLVQPLHGDDGAGVGHDDA